MQPHRAGTSLAEVLISVTVIATLTALLLPAVQTAREAARRNECQSHLRQIGIAIHSYESDYAMWPAGGSNGWSWHSAILPYIDQELLAQSIDDSQNADTERQRVGQVLIALYLCPSDSISPITGGRATSYMGNGGTGVLTDGYNGMFRYIASSRPGAGGPIRSTDAVDGTSNTTAVAEILHSPGAPTQDRLRMAWNLPADYTADRAHLFLKECMELPENPVLAGYHGSWLARGNSWPRGDTGVSTYNHAAPPMSPSCFNGQNVQTGIFSSGSLHSGSVNILLSDGHIESVSISVDSGVWMDYGSRNGSLIRQ